MARERKEININIGANIKRARESAGFTQEKFSEYIDVSVQYVSDLERGVVGTSIPTLMKICEILNVSSDYLLFNKTGSKSGTLLKSRLDSLSDAELALAEQGLNNILDAIHYIPN